LKKLLFFIMTSMVSRRYYTKLAVPLIFFSIGQIAVWSSAPERSAKIIGLAWGLFGQPKIESENKTEREEKERKDSESDVEDKESPSESDLASKIDSSTEKFAKQSLLAVVNPNSGARRGARCIEKLEAAGIPALSLLDFSAYFARNAGDKCTEEDNKKCVDSLARLKTIMEREELDVEKCKNANDGSMKRPIVLAGGGDGTIASIIQLVQEVNKGEDHIDMTICPMPLGTGNDLCRSLGWGTKNPNPKSLHKLLSTIKAQTCPENRILLDRWRIQITPRCPTAEPSPLETLVEERTPVASQVPTLELKLSPKKGGASETNEVILEEEVDKDDRNPPADTNEPREIMGSREVSIEPPPHFGCRISTSNPASPSRASQLSSVETQLRALSTRPCGYGDNFLCYFTVGYDAGIALEWEKSRQTHPERFKSQLVNNWYYITHGASEFFVPSKPLDLRIFLDGKEVEFPAKARSLKILNINSAMQGTDYWIRSRRLKDDPLYSQQQNEAQNPGDQLLEVVCTTGLKADLFHVAPVRLGQAKEIKIVLNKTTPCEMDGEPWSQDPAEIVISLRDQTPFLLGPSHPGSKTGRQTSS